MAIGKLEVIEVPEEGKRFLIHLNKPDVTVLKRIKADKKLNNLPLGKYDITDEYQFIGRCDNAVRLERKRKW